MKILHFEDEPNDVALARELLMTEWPDCTILHVSNPAALRSSLAADNYDLILADFNVRGFDGHSTLRVAREVSPTTPLIFLSGTIDDEHAFALLRDGASDYVLKHRMERLSTVIPRVMREMAERRGRIYAETELKESEARFRSIFVNLVEGVVLVNTLGLIESANPSAARILGMTTSQLVGRSLTADWRSVREDNSPFDANDFPGAVVLRTRQPHGGTVMGFYQPEGGLIWVNVHAQPMVHETDARLTGVVITFHDITEKKRLEEQFFRAQRLESLGLLAAGIAHDLNNVLAPVLMGSHILRERVTDVGDRKLLETVEKSAERGAEIVRQILGFAKGASGGHHEVQVKHLVRDLQALLQASLPKSIKIESRSSAEPWVIKANPTQLHQVLLNLCVNARDAMPAGGVLGITIFNHQLDLRTALALGSLSPGPYVLIEISDTGTGIAPEILARIWEPFFTTKDADKGTGLGLSTARGIIQNHNGHIEVQTEPGKGTTFRLFIPAIAQAGAQAANGTNRPFFEPVGHGEVILVVDDEPEIRELATTLLSEKGYIVLAVRDGVQAFAQLQNRSDIRLVITDLNMPEMDGAGLALLARRQFPSLKILAISGRGSATGLSADFRRHTDGFLPKPFTPRALFSAVQKLLDAGKGA